MGVLFAVGVTNQSVDVQIVDDTGLPVTGLAAATFPALTYSLAGPNADVAFPALSDLAAITTAYASGGVKERGGGYYRLDVPDGAFAVAGKVTIRGNATGKHVRCPQLDVGGTGGCATAASLAVVQSTLSAIIGGSTGATLLFDTFTGTDGTLLSAHTPDVGPGWTVHSGGATINSNGISATSTPMFATMDAGSTEVVVEADLSPHQSSSGNYRVPGLLLGAVDSVTHLRVQLLMQPQNQLLVYKSDFGVWVRIPFTFVSDQAYHVKVVRSAGLVGVYVDGTEYIGNIPWNNAFTRCGITIDNVGSPIGLSRIDNFRTSTFVLGSALPAQVATAVFTDLVAGSDFATPSSFGALAAASFANGVTLAAGTIEDASFTVPAESGPPTGIVGKIAWLAARLGLHRNYNDKVGGSATVYKANGTTVWTVSAYTADVAHEDVGAAT